MFVRRCAWHRKYNGHAKFLGVSSWRGWGVTFSDGMCRDCAAKARAEWQLPPSTRPAPPPRFNRSFRPDFAFAAAVLLLGLAATFGAVVGPPRPAQQTARVEVTPAPIATAPVEPGTATAPSERVVAERAPAERTPAGRAAEQRVGADRTPSPQIPAAVAEAPGVSHRAPARPIRVVRASAKRPVLAAYQPLERSMLEIVRTPETPVAKPIVVAAAWRPWPDGHAFQAP